MTHNLKQQGTMQDSYNVKVCVNNGCVGVPERWKCAKPGEVEEGKLYVRNWLYIKEGRIQEKDEAKLK